MELKPPYLLFLGDTSDPFAIKLARGIVDWRPELAIGELRLPGCSVTTGISEMTVTQGKEAGANSLVLGLANSGGTISPSWIDTIKTAIRAGMDIISGMHQALNDMPEMVSLANEYNIQLHDIRHPKQVFKTGTGYPRNGRRILTVGTDCSAGKMYTALALEKAMKKDHSVSFKATGQSGILIAGEGIAVDCVISDFISGAVESLSPDTAPDHWDIIEGQGSLLHPAFAGVSLGLLHGSQPDALVLCHVEGRESMRGLKGRALPSLEDTMALNLQAARTTNQNVKFIGISVNSSALTEDEANARCKEYEQRLGLPVVDPFRHGIQPIVDNL